MASNKNDETIVDVVGAYSKTEKFLNDNGKSISYIMIAVIALMAGYLIYKNFVVEPQSAEASTNMWKAEWYFEKDSFQVALSGNAEYYGFLDIIDEYGATSAGNLAKHYAGVCYLNLGQYEDAISYLDDASFDDMMVEATRLGALGDANVELGNYQDAISYYKKSVSHTANDFTTPLYLKKMALAYEEVGDLDKALDAYQRISSEFGESTFATDIEKYIGRLTPLVN